MGSQFPTPHAQNQTTIIQNSTKKTMGRRKIEIKPIQNKNNLQVTFSKRRGGVFKKAGELSVLCGAEVAIIVRSPANKVYTFCNPDVDAVLHRFETGSSSQVTDSIASSSSKKAYVESIRRLEKEKKRGSKELHEPYGVNWWDMGFEGMELYELDEYLAALMILKSNVFKKVDEIEKKKVGLEFGSSLEVDFEGGVVGKYDDWQALFYEDQFINAGESNTWMFGG